MKRGRIRRKIERDSDSRSSGGWHNSVRMMGVEALSPQQGTSSLTSETHVLYTAEKAPSPSPLPSFSTTTVYGAMGWGASSCRRRGLDEMGWDRGGGERLLIRCANSALVGGKERAYKTLPSPTFILRRVARGAKLLRRPLGAILAARKMRKNEESARLQFQDLPICIHCV